MSDVLSAKTIQIYKKSGMFVANKRKPGKLLLYTRIASGLFIRKSSFFIKRFMKSSHFLTGEASSFVGKLLLKRLVADGLF